MQGSRASAMKTTLGLCAASLIALTGYSPAHGHWPGQPEHQMAQLGDLKLESGEVIRNFRMSYVTHGKLNAARDNALVFLHGFGGNHHGIDHMIGPGRPLDTDRYFVVCPDALGATQFNYEHTTSPTSSGLKMKFPFYNQRDMVNATYRLLTEALELPHALAITGSSMGGRHSVQFAISYPTFMDGIIPVVGSGSTTFSASKGRFRIPVMGSSITACGGWNNGDYDDNPKTCASNAMTLLALNFFTTEWWARYVDTPEAYTKWRNNVGEYLDVQDARDLLYMLSSGGRSSVADTPGFDNDLRKALGSVKARALFVYNPRDELAFASDVEFDIRAVPHARGVAIDSIAGHYITANGDPDASQRIGDVIRRFLDELSAQRLNSR